MLQRFSCSPWTLLQLTDITTAAVRTLVLDLDSARRIILITVTIPATIHPIIPITMDTAIHHMDSALAITGRIMVMDMADMAAITADIAVDTMVGIAVDTMEDMAAITADIAVVIMADIAADTMADIAVDTMEDMGVPYRNSVRTKHLAYS